MELSPAQLMPRVLGAAEIEELSRQADFAQAGEPVATTMQFKPIDQALRQAKEQWRLAQEWGFPEFHFSGQLVHPPVPEPARRHYPEALWNGASEAVFFRVQGLDVSGFPVLAFMPAPLSADAPALLSFWGLAQGVLIHERSLPMAVVEAIGAPDAIKAAFARFEARQIEGDAAPTSESQPPKRV